MMTYLEEFAEYSAGRIARPNPFKRDAQGHIRSPLAIAEYAKTNPELAKKLCAEAGERWATWFPNNPL